METLAGYNLMYRCTAIIFIAYYIFTASSVHCATTTRTSLNCYNESKQVVVNETTLEWCAVFSSLTCYFTSSCYCNVTREVAKVHVTTVCEELTLVDGDDKAASRSNTKWNRKLGDPEVAAIAVISSLIFSIILSLIVFLIQRRHRNQAAQKDSQTVVVQVEKVGGDEPDESVSFLPPADGKRYIHVEPANREQNVFEDTHGSPHNEKAEMSLVKKNHESAASGKPGGGAETEGSGPETEGSGAEAEDSGPEMEDSGPEMEDGGPEMEDGGAETALLESTSPTIATEHSNGTDSPAEPVGSPDTDAPTAGSDTDEDEPISDSALSLKLNCSKEHYENAPTSDV